MLERIIRYAPAAVVSVFLLAQTAVIWTLSTQLDRQAGEVKAARVRVEAAETGKAQCLRQLSRQSEQIAQMGQASDIAKAVAAEAAKSAQAQTARLERRINDLRLTAPGPDACAVARQTIINTLSEDRR